MLLCAGDNGAPHTETISNQHYTSNNSKVQLIWDCSRLAKMSQCFSRIPLDVPTIINHFVIKWHNNKRCYISIYLFCLIYMETGLRTTWWTAGDIAIRTVLGTAWWVCWAARKLISAVLRCSSSATDGLTLITFLYLHRPGISTYSTR